MRRSWAQALRMASLPERMFTIMMKDRVEATLPLPPPRRRFVHVVRATARDERLSRGTAILARTGKVSCGIATTERQAGSFEAIVVPGQLDEPILLDRRNFPHEALRRLDDFVIDDTWGRRRPSEEDRRRMGVQDL